MNLKPRFNWLTNKHADDINRLAGAFPKALNDDVREVLAMLPFEKENVLLSDGTRHRVDNFLSGQDFQLTLRGERICSPYRLYLDEPEPSRLDNLSDDQRTVVNCIYLRHHNGHVRQNHLKKLVRATDYFICPFIVQFIGEYVIELLYIVESAITPTTLNEYSDFIISNPLYWKKTKSRMTSYWDAYHRRDFPELREYIGKRLVNRLDSAARDLSVRHGDEVMKMQ